MHRRNYLLKNAICEKGMTQRQIANTLGITELEMSRIVTGRLSSDDDFKEKMCGILEKTREEIFPKWILPDIEQL